MLKRTLFTLLGLAIGIGGCSDKSDKDKKHFYDYTTWSPITLKDGRQLRFEEVRERLFDSYKLTNMKDDTIRTYISDTEFRVRTFFLSYVDNGTRRSKGYRSGPSDWHLMEESEINPDVVSKAQKDFDRFLDSIAVRKAAQVRYDLGK